MLAYAPPRESVRKSPSALTIVVALHVAGLAALMLAKPELVTFTPTPPTEVTFIDEIKPPPPPPPPSTPRETVPTDTVTPLPTTILPVVDLPIAGPSIGTDHVLDTVPGPADLGTIDVGLGEIGPPALARTEARLKTPPARLKPDYPASKRRSGEEATLRLRLDVDAVGRVTRVTPLGSYDPVFFEAAERHILKYWRYEPATLGGDAIADDTVVSLQFTLDD